MFGNIGCLAVLKFLDTTLQLSYIYRLKMDRIVRETAGEFRGVLT